MWSKKQASKLGDTGLQDGKMRGRWHQIDELSQLLSSLYKGKRKNLLLKLDLFSVTKESLTIHKAKNLWHFLKKVLFPLIGYTGFATDKQCVCKVAI